MSLKTQINMNFLQQTKLTKEEWEYMEKPLGRKQEYDILKMIDRGYDDIETKYYPYLCLRQFLNIQEKHDIYIFQQVLLPRLKKLNKNNVLKIEELLTCKTNTKINKAETIKLNNSIGLFEKQDYDDKIIELVLCTQIKSMLKQKKKNKDCGIYLFNLNYLYKQYDNLINPNFKNIINYIIENNKKEFSLYEGLKHVSSYLEHNTIFKYQNCMLYSHQKELITLFHQDQEVQKFAFYCAPTSTGKTLSPLALSNGYKVLFVCASKHIGLGLAKNAYALKKKVGFAFGCNDISQIRLNYNAICSYKETKYGRKIVDHSDGKMVDIMISDVNSFEYALLYMKAFHSIEKMILFWDEPTIGLDVESHPLHDKIKYNWSINEIPNIVFSCATLPKKDKLNKVIQNFKKRFPNSMIKYIESHDQSTNLMIYDEYENVMMPHNYFEDYKQLCAFLEYQGNKYYKFYNGKQCASFLLFYDKKFQQGFIETEFDMCNFSLYHIKDTYIKCLQSISCESWTNVRCEYLKQNPWKESPSNYIGCELTTKHSYSLTNGPTLYICDQISNICKYLLYITKMDPKLLKNIEKKIKENNDISELLMKKRKDYEDKIEKFKDNEKIMENMRFPPDVMELHREISALEQRICSLHVDPLFLPNSRNHLQKWHSDLDYDTQDVYTSHVDDASIKTIMQLIHIPYLYKVLLLMGIGVFSNQINDTKESIQDNNTYVECIKQLAEEKSLYLIIANSDYIYGTNYQFSHCYLGKDMKNMSQEKIIQCIGRIGRQEKNKHFSFRFRSKQQIDLLYAITENNIESINMNKLFV